MGGNACSTEQPQQEPVLYTKPIQIKRRDSLELDQAYPALTQEHAKMYVKSNAKADPLESKEELELEDDGRTVSTSCSLTTLNEIKESGIGPYYLKNELEFLKYRLTTKELRKLEKNENRWEKALNSKSSLSMDELPDEHELNTKEEANLKEYSLLHPRVFPKMLHRGPPMKYRWVAWKFFLKPQRFFIKGVYEKLKSLSSHWEHQIRRDTHRTYPEEPYFSADESGSTGQDSLFNVLKAISLYFPNIGYTQGMNYLVGLLLLVSGGNELESFWMYVALSRDPKFLTMGVFDYGFPLLDFYVTLFYEALEAKLPQISHHLKQVHLPTGLWLVKWFLTIFIEALPAKQVVRVWDFILKDGLLGVVKVGLGILKFVEEDFVKLDDIGMDYLFKYIRGDKRRISEAPEIQFSFKELDIEEVLSFARQITFDFSLSDFVQKYEERTMKKLVEPYRSILLSQTNSPQNVNRFQEIQEDLNYYFIKNELLDKKCGHVVPEERPEDYEEEEEEEEEEDEDEEDDDEYDEDDYYEAEEEEYEVEDVKSPSKKLKMIYRFLTYLTSPMEKK